jgi:hypothetical protein
MNAINVSVAASLAAVLGLAACSGGGGSSVSPVPSGTHTGTGSLSKSARTTITFRIPAAPAGAGTSNDARQSKAISPGTDKLTLIVDGTKAFNAMSIYNTGGPYNYTSSDGNTKLTLNNTASNGYFTFAATIDTLPGNHTLGVVLISGTPAIVLSEGQITYGAMQPGVNAPQSLTLNGAIGSGYIECDTAANNNLNNGCANSFNTATGLYTLTAVAADFNGFPIVGQGSTTFDNGSLAVVETTTPSHLLTLSNNGPFTTPGTQLSGPSGSWYTAGTYSYGQPFNVKCNSLGTATLGLVLSGTGGPTNPVTGQSYSAGTNYPAGGTLPAGSKYPGNPSYHGGVNPYAVYSLATVSCDANMVLTIQ